MEFQIGGSGSGGGGSIVVTVTVLACYTAGDKDVFVKLRLENLSFILDSWRRDDPPFRSGRDRDDRFHRERERDRDRDRERDRDRDRDRERDRDRDRDWDRDRGKNSWDQEKGTDFKFFRLYLLDFIT